MLQLTHYYTKIKKYKMNKHEKAPISQQNIIKTLQATDPKRHVAFIAIEQLKKREEIQEFYKEYIQLLKDSEVKDPEKIAQQNIGYIVGYYDKETADKWMKTLPNVSHPVFGKNIPFNDPDAAFQASRNANKN